jgi:uncharacterized protein (DUF1697 family)
LTTYISMLRGINVGKQKRIRMEELRGIYTSSGFKNISTYLQSGNVIFSTAEGDIASLTRSIESRIEQNFHFTVPVLIRTSDELRNIIQNNPFGEETGLDTSKLYITFLSLEPTISNKNQIRAITDNPDKFVIGQREIYLFCPESYARTKFSNTFFEQKLGVIATTRNWNSVMALLEIASVTSP